MSTPTAPLPSPVRQEWLDRWEEEIIEPDLPIIDPHHHLWDRPGWRYLLDELLADLNSGHNIVATVFLQCARHVPGRRPGGDAPVGETEFVNGVAAMSASGGYGPTRVCAGIVGHVDLRLGATASTRCWRRTCRRRRALPRHPHRTRLGCLRADVRTNVPRPLSARRSELPRGVRATGAARPLLRRLAVSAADSGADRRWRAPSPRPPSSSITSARRSGSVHYAGRRDELLRRMARQHPRTGNVPECRT